MSTDAASRLSTLYLEDETAWLDEMSRLAAERRYEEFDFENLSEYLISMANRDRREVEQRLVVLLTHLLKWQHQPERRSRSWVLTIVEQRDELRSLLTGVLRRHAEESLEAVYRRARRRASVETDLPESTFPERFAGTLDGLLAEDAEPRFPST
jgi:hypothetical protein